MTNQEEAINQTTHATKKQRGPKQTHTHTHTQHTKTGWNVKPTPERRNNNDEQQQQQFSIWDTLDVASNAPSTQWNTENATILENVKF